MSKLTRFRQTPELISRYREARAILESIHFDTVMLELGVGTGDVDSKHPNAISANALENQRRQGFMDAVSFLFGADTVGADKGALSVAPDYNYAQTLLDSGRISQDEYNKMIQEQA